MKVLDPGHDYLLDILDAPSDHSRPERLTFVKREGDGYPGNVGHYAGTNIQEVLRALIDRVKYLDGQIPCSENRIVLGNLRTALVLLEVRAARRHYRSADTILLLTEPELATTCTKCGHVGCGGECH